MENTAPVLEPPPGFEDPPVTIEHMYDSPPREDRSRRSAFHEVPKSSASSTRLRPKKQGPHLEDIYSLPIDSLNSKKSSPSYRHSMGGLWAGTSEPVHMSLDEVRHYLREIHNSDVSKSDRSGKRSRKSLLSTGLKEALFSVFRIPHFHHSPERDENKVCTTGWTFSAPNVSKLTKDCFTGSHRALPPVPQEELGFVPVQENEEGLADFSASLRDLPKGLGASKTSLDFAASIEEVKTRGWYWGPLPGEVAEKILANEPDGSFLVRDSSDDRYIFSLSFKLNGGVRHVRIEHDQGNFSFGSVTRFRSQTMVEFIEQAVEHSRSGRFLFFLHRRPTVGPTRVQLINPLSRFRHVQSLQHLCRFAILRLIRRDQIEVLPLPARLKEYLNTAHYYLENV